MVLVEGPDCSCCGVSVSAPATAPMAAKPCRCIGDRSVIAPTTRHASTASDSTSLQALTIPTLPLAEAPPTVYPSPLIPSTWLRVPT